MSTKPRRPIPGTIEVATLRANIHRLRTTIHGARVALEDGKPDLAAEALRVADDASAAASLLIAEHTTRVEGFVQAFNRLCRLHGMPAAVAIPIPSPIPEGMVQIKLGGHGDTVRLVARMMDKPAELKPDPPAPALVGEAVPG